jgi:putative copper export protein
MLVICVAISTAEQRAEARQRLKRYSLPAWILTAVLLAVLLLGHRGGAPP